MIHWFLTRGDYSKAIILGLVTSFLWAFQHPLQNPLYQSVSGEMESRLAIVLFAELLAVIFFSFLLWKKEIRHSIPLVFRAEKFKKTFAISVTASFASLLIYANSQSNLGGATIAVTIALSPFAALFANIYVNKGRLGQTLSEGVKSKEFYAHVAILLSVTLVALLILQTTDSSQTSNMSRILQWLQDKGIAVVATLLVPFLYFLSAGAVAENYSKLGGNVHLAAIFVSAMLGAIFAGLCLWAFFWFKGTMLLALVSRFEMQQVILFSVGSATAGVLATLTLHFSFRLPENEGKLTSIMFHTVPIFSVFIGQVLWILLRVDGAKLSILHVTSSITVALVTILFYRDKLFNNKDLQETYEKTED